MTGSGNTKARLIGKSDIILIAIWAVFALCLILFSHINPLHDTKEKMLEITVGDRVFGTYSLDEDRVIEIGNGNTCTIEGGTVRMTDADCPDKVCVRSRSISEPGESIVCLPNSVILKITGDDPGKGGVDAVTE